MSKEDHKDGDKEFIEEFHKLLGEIREELRKLKEARMEARKKYPKLF